MARLPRLVSAATFAALAVSLSGAAPGSAAGGCADATLKPSRDNVQRMRTATLCLLNAERAKRDLAPLRSNKQLRKAAQAYSRKMVREHFFDHTCPEGTTVKSRIKSTRYLRGRYARWALGENLAWGSGSLATPKAIVRSWMDSAPHRSSILHRKFRDVGIGVSTGAPAQVAGRAATYTTDFGYRVKR